MASDTCMVPEDPTRRVRRPARPAGGLAAAVRRRSSVHRRIVFGSFLFLLALLTSLPPTSECRGPVCPPRVAPEHTP